MIPAPVPLTLLFELTRPRGTGLFVDLSLSLDCCLRQFGLSDLHALLGDRVRERQTRYPGGVARAVRLGPLANRPERSIRPICLDHERSALLFPLVTDETPQR